MPKYLTLYVHVLPLQVERSQGERGIPQTACRAVEDMPRKPLDAVERHTMGKGGVAHSLSNSPLITVLYPAAKRPRNALGRFFCRLGIFPCLSPKIALGAKYGLVAVVFSLMPPIVPMRPASLLSFFLLLPRL